MTDSYEEVRSNWVKFNKQDDYIKGTLIDIFVPDALDQYGKKNRTYIMKGIEGKFFGNDENKVVDSSPTSIEPGEIYRVGSKPQVDAQMTKIQLGQKVMFKLTELRPTKKGNPAKIIKVFAGPMDESFVKDVEEKAKAEAEFNAA